MRVKKKPCDGCGESRYIWKNVVEDGERKRYCKICWSCRNGDKHKSTSRKPLASRSPKRRKQESEYSKERRIYLVDRPTCRAGIPGKCTHKSTDVHHKAGRIAELLLNQKYWLAVCRQCHDWIESHPEEAKALGHSISKT